MMDTESPLLSSTPSRRSLLRGAAYLAGLGIASPLVAACGSSATQGGSKTIGLSLNGFVEYDKYVAEGVAKALDGSGYDLKILQADFTDRTELSNLKSLINQGVAGLVILPNTLNTVLTGIKGADEKNIPCSLCLWAIPTVVDPYVEGVAAVDSVEGGRMIGDWVKANATPGKVVVVQGVVGQGFSENIDKGVDESLKGSGFEIVVREQGYFDRTKATEVVQRALQAHPDITVVIDYAAAMGNGIATHLKQQNITNITHVTSDADEEMLGWIGSPFLAASRYYSAGETGLIGGQIILDALDGKYSGDFKVPAQQVMMTAANKDATIKKIPLRYPEFADKLRGL